MGLTYDKFSVTWEYLGVQFSYKADNIWSASLELEYVYASIYSKQEFTSIFLTLDAKLIVSSNSKFNFINVLDKNNKEINIKIPFKKDVHVSPSLNVYVTTCNYEKKTSKLIKLSRHGEKLYEYTCPDSYFIVRFFSFIDNEKEIKIICGGPKDEYGKDTYCLSLNAETGEWKVLYSMLDK